MGRARGGVIRGGVAIICICCMGCAWQSVSLQLRFPGTASAVRRVARGAAILRAPALKSSIIGGEGDALISSAVPPPITLSSSGQQIRSRLARGVRNSVKKNSYDTEIFDLAVPTLAAVLIDPMLSLVDTLFVGRLGAVSLGALGPCTALCNFVFACAACVLLVSTSVITARHNAAKDFVSLGRTIVLASSIAVASGITFAFLFLAFPHFFLSLLGASPALMSEAVPYLLWRASAFPAALFLLVAAGCFRGIGSPAETLRTGALVGAINLILDPLLMFYFGLGTAGAAIATAAAQWAGALSYIRIMFIRRKELGLNAGTLVRDVADQALPPPEPQAKKEKAPILMPRRRDVVDFMGAGSAMLFRSVLNVGAWTVMASAAARLGVFEIAAHQLVLSVWLVLAFFQEALGASGQVLVARTFGTTDSTGKPLEARSIAKRILTLSLLLGSSLAAAASVLMPPIIPFMCKSDEVVKLVRQALPVALSGLPLCCVVWSWDQVFYGAGDFRFNASVVAFASVTAVGVMTATMALGGGLGALWMTMIHFFFAIRLVGHVVRFNSHSGPFGRSTADLATAAATVPSA